MRVLLVGPDLEENLSLRYLVSSLRKAGHQPTIAAFDTTADTSSVLAAAGSADLVGLSMCYQVRAPEFLSLARQLKQARPSCPVIAGGHYASCAADELLAQHHELDLIVIHEGEQTLVKLAGLPTWTSEALASIPGLVYRVGGTLAKSPPPIALADLDSLPWPERSGPARLMAGVPTAYLMGSRGCLSACDYCCISTMHRMVSGARFRQRSPEDIVGEMASLYHERGVRQFIFHDDNFLVPQVERNLERIDAIDRGMRRQRLRQVALALKCRPGDVDQQVFLRLREMGLLRVFLGIESGSRTGLASIGRRQTVAQEHRALDVCADLGISAQYTMIMFHPEASLASMREDLAFVAAHPAYPLSFCRAEIYTGTPLEQRMQHESRAFGTYLAREYTYSDPLTLHAWNAAYRLLSARCFAPNHLLGQIVRLDHQAAVLQHFYEGRDVDALVADFAAFELAANRETVGVIEALFALCEAYPDAKADGFTTRFAELDALERVRCHALLTRACAFRDAIAERSFGVLGLARGTRVPMPDRSFLERLPRHAAAVFLAVGLMNCKSNSDVQADARPAVDRFTDQIGMFEVAPQPLDARAEAGADLRADAGADLRPDASSDASADAGADLRADAGVSEAGALDGDRADTKKDAVLYTDQGGMFEAPPPPMDAKKDMVVYTDQGGMFEAPPPPMDAKKDTVVYTDQGGMFEAPPPPMDAALKRD